MLVDTHCHLADPALEADRDGVLARARAAGVGHVVAVGESPERAGAAIALARAVPGVSATAGLHPHEAAGWSGDVEAWIDRTLADPVVVAAGEMGLDYHYDFAPRHLQREAFEAQMALAARHGLPAVIHAREADDDVATVLRNHPAAVAVLHSFSSGERLLDTALELGHYVSWSGMITFRNWQNDAQIRRVPLDRLLVETDAPYLAPVPYRGKRNEPAFVAETARRLAQVIGRTVEEVVTLTTENAVRAFGTRLRQSLEVVP